MLPEGNQQDQYNGDESESELLHGIVFCHDCHDLLAVVNLLVNENY